MKIEDFIKKANKKHNNKFCYEKSIYVNTSTPLTITCSKHGDFLQKPEAHLKGSGCKQCRDEEKVKTNNNFIKELEEKYKTNKYNFDEVVYKGAFEKVKVICKTHGEFYNTPNFLLNKKRNEICPFCAKESRNIKIKEKKNNNTLLLLSKKYDCEVSKISQIDSSHVQMFCKTHGFYVKRKTALLQGFGCPMCSEDNIVNKNKEKFFKKAKQIHHNFYVYNEESYVGSYVKIPIICPKHGEFWQTPNMHLQMQGCPKCSMSKGELKIVNFFKENNITFITQKSFDDCKYKRRLKFDFYLPEYNICIEYDGELHFYENYKGVKTNLELTKLKDEIKNEYCKTNNIKLIRIKYTENVTNKLNTIKNETKQCSSSS